MDGEDQIRPFQFEPMYAEGESGSDLENSSSDDEEPALDHTVVLRSSSVGRSNKPADEWCECAHCSSDCLTDMMCLCCKEWTLIEDRFEENSECIARHRDLQVLCLNRVVLLSMWPYIMAFKGIHGPIPHTLSNRTLLQNPDFCLKMCFKTQAQTFRQYRLVAYRQFVHWANKGRRMGRGVRVVLPSCVVQQIRKAFPEDKPEDYTGFKEVMEVDELLEEDL